MTATAADAATATTVALEATGLTKEYDGVPAVDGLSLRISRGEFFGLLGPNGAGKTTTIHMLATLLRPTRGRALVAGFDVLRQSLAVRRQIGIVFQETTLDLELTAEENLRFAARLYGLDVTEVRLRIDRLLALFGLTDRRHHRVRTFSGGMRRALDLARGLLHRPAILFLDEPTLGLDPVHRRRIWEFLHRMRAEEGTTLLLTTHYLEEADSCDAVAIMDRGRLIAEGSPDRLKAAYGGESVEVDCPEVDDLLIGEVRKRTGCTVRRRANGLTVVGDSAQRILPALLPLVGAGVTGVRIRRTTLDDVFVAVAGRPSGIEEG